MTSKPFEKYSLIWIERFARFGYFCKGVVYTIVGFISGQATLNRNIKATDTEGALHAIVSQPFGKILLLAIIVGLIGYIIWRFVQAIKDPDNKGNKVGGLVQRAGYIINGFAYSGLAMSAIQILINIDDSEGDSTKFWVEAFISQPYGEWLVILAGVAVVGVAINHFYMTFVADSLENIDFQNFGRWQRYFLVGICRFGLFARGILFSLIGWFLVEAGVNANADFFGGLSDALDALGELSYAYFLLEFVSLGLISYGFYMFIQSRYRRFLVDEL